MIRKYNEISFNLNTKIYSKELIFKTAYVFIDKLYIYFDSASDGDMIVTLRAKDKSRDNQLEELKGEFSNELLNVLLRENASERNKKIVEIIIGGAITASLRGTKVEPGDGWLNEKQNAKEDKELEMAVESLRHELAQFDNKNENKASVLNVSKQIKNK